MKDQNWTQDMNDFHCDLHVLVCVGQLVDAGVVGKTEMKSLESAIRIIDKQQDKLRKIFEKHYEVYDAIGNE